MVESAKDNDLFTGHEHEIFRFGGRVVDESGACADAALLERKARPSVECVCVHLARRGEELVGNWSRMEQA